MKHRTEETSQMTQESGVLGDPEQAKKERHDPHQADRKVDSVTGGAQDGVGKRLHLAGERGQQDGSQRDRDDETVEHGARAGTLAKLPLRRQRVVGDEELTGPSGVALLFH